MSAEEGICPKGWDFTASGSVFGDGTCWKGFDTESEACGTLAFVHTRIQIVGNTTQHQCFLDGSEGDGPVYADSCCGYPRPNATDCGEHSTLWCPSFLVDGPEGRDYCREPWQGGCSHHGECKQVITNGTLAAECVCDSLHTGEFCEEVAYDLDEIEENADLLDEVVNNYTTHLLDLPARVSALELPEQCEGNWTSWTMCLPYEPGASAGVRRRFFNVSTEGKNCPVNRHQEEACSLHADLSITDPEGCSTETEWSLCRFCDFSPQAKLGQVRTGDNTCATVVLETRACYLAAECLKYGRPAVWTSQKAGYVEDNRTFVAVAIVIGVLAVLFAVLGCVFAMNGKAAARRVEQELADLREKLSKDGLDTAEQGGGGFREPTAPLMNKDVPEWGSRQNHPPTEAPVIHHRGGQRRSRSASKRGGRRPRAFPQ